MIVEPSCNGGLHTMNTKLIITSVVTSIIGASAFLLYLANSPLGAGALLGYLALVSIVAVGSLEYGPQRSHTVKK
jgi:hypothetical protein